jgi:Glycosyl hydrolase family 66
MTTAPFPALKTFYLSGQPVYLPQLPHRADVVVARSAFGRTQCALVHDGAATLPSLAPGTYAIEARSHDGSLLAEELTTVAATHGDRPVPGFVTSFDAGAVPGVLGWLRDLRCTSVQFYDWMQTYAAPLADTDSYTDRLGRKHSLTAIAQLTDGCRAFGATPQAYAPVYAADPDFGRAHPEWLLSRSDSGPQRLGDLLEITNPGNPDWQLHWLDSYGAAADALGFGGFHLDTYGYPREPLDASGRPVAMDAAYAGFLRTVRSALPAHVVSFNQVNGVPRGFKAAGPPGYRYVEVWPPNDRWRHLESLLQRSAPGAGASDGGASDGLGQLAVLAIYPPVWTGDRAAGLRTVVLTEAITVTLGASMLVFGDDQGCLQHPYYPDYQPLTADDSAHVLRWHRFGLRCRDLFAAGTDTSWYDIGDENGAVSVQWEDGGSSGAVLPEPVGGAVYVRVVRHEECVAVSVLDLSGSKDGSWQSPTGAGRCRRAMVSVLLDRPGDWHAEAAVLGQDGDRFAPVNGALGVHREGSSIEIELPVVAGWSVLRLTRAA